MEGTRQGLRAGKAPPPPQERSHLSCSRTCFLAGALAGGGWVMAAPRDQVGSCALEHPPQSWTMLGWGAGPREGSLSHEFHLKDRAPQLLTSGLSNWPGEGSQPRPAACFLAPQFSLGCLLFTEPCCHCRCGKAGVSTRGPRWWAVWGWGRGQTRSRDWEERGGEERLQKEGERGEEAAQGQRTEGSKLGPR